MANLGREGHRERVKEVYKKHGLDTMSDHNVLELLLFYAIPRKDVKPIAYNLINRFKTLDNVFNADIETLKTVDGIGENTAILISLLKDINTKINESKNKDITMLGSSEKSKEYAENLLKFCKDEKVIMICLDNNCNIIDHHTISQGTVNFSVVDEKTIIKTVITDDASSVIIAHNHPNGEAVPSTEDVNFTIELLNLLRKIRVDLNDHIIVGKTNTLSMRMSAKYCTFFD